MNLRCPACGAEIDFEAAVRGTETEALAKAAALFGSDWELVGEYVDLFRARRDAALALKKRLRLLREVWEIWRNGQFDFDGQAYQVGRLQVKEAMVQVCNRDLQGLKNHNYLKQILKAAAREFGKQKEEARLALEEQLRAGARFEPKDALPVNPEIPKLVKQALFGHCEEERSAAKARLAEMGVKTCQNQD